jgi:heme/copper-type cytochrome/quinol oxidase subunit 1
MNSSRLRPKVVIWWGIAVAVGGALLVVLAPWVLGTAISFRSQGEQDFLVTMNVILDVARSVLPPLGGALIAAGIVMLYVERLWSTRESPTSGEPEDLRR